MKGTVWLLTALTITTSCTRDGDAGRFDYHDQQTTASVAPASAIYRDTQLVNQEKLLEVYSKKFHHIVSLTTLKGDTVVRYAPYYFKHQYLDINKDGHADIRMYVYSNTPNQCENYFYDSKIYTYHKIHNADLDIKKIPGTSLYYSHHRAGCASMNWASTLSKIEDWQEINIGQLEIDSCGGDTERITIYKVSNGKETLISKLGIQELARFKSKPDFIYSYWKRNYKRFE